MNPERYKHFILTFKKCIQGFKPMNSKIFAAGAVVILAAVLSVFVFPGNSLISDFGDAGFSPFHELHI